MYIGKDPYADSHDHTTYYVLIKLLHLVSLEFNLSEKDQIVDFQINVY